MSQPIKFYYDLLSQPARALYVFLKLNNIPFEKCPISITKGEHLTPEYKDTVNRFRKIPCINDNGFRLAETPAILQYLLRKHEATIDDHWYPKESKARARVDEYLSWQHQNTRQHCTTYFWLHYVVPLRTGKTVSERHLKEAKVQMEQTLDIIETVWLKDQRYIAGGQISIADLLAVSELEQIRLNGEDASAGRPKMKIWMDLVRKETQVAHDEAYVVLNKVVAKLQQSKL